MAGIVDVADPGDPRLADYARLTDVRLRTSMESAHGLFMAEGEKVIRRAVAAGFGVRSMLVTRDKLAGLADLAGTLPGPGLRDLPGGRRAGHRIPGAPRRAGLDGPPCAPGGDQPVVR